MPAYNETKIIINSLINQLVVGSTIISRKSTFKVSASSKINCGGKSKSPPSIAVMICSSTPDNTASVCLENPLACLTICRFRPDWWSASFAVIIYKNSHLFLSLSTAGTHIVFKKLLPWPAGRFFFCPWMVRPNKQRPDAKCNPKLWKGILRIRCAEQATCGNK